MSKKKKILRERRAAREEEQGKKVVRWIFGGFIALAIITLAWFCLTQM